MYEWKPCQHPQKTQKEENNAMNENNIIYPDLVEHSYQIMKSQGVQITKEKLYKKLVKSDMLDKYGQPTQMALDEGLVDTYTRLDDGTYQPKSLETFKQDNPMYADYADNHFTWIDGKGWAVDEYVIRAEANDIINDSNSTQEQRQAAYAMLDYANHKD